MAKILHGKEVSEKLLAALKEDAAELLNKGIVPTLAILRVGDKDENIAYEKSVIKRCDDVGIVSRCFLLPEKTDENRLISVISEINHDDKIHGMLIFLPLPEHINEELIRNSVHPEKDIDGITAGSMAGVYSGSGTGFPPCTAEACIEMLDYYGYDVKGKKAVIIGRSTVVGKPAAMMLLKKNATVTICHTGTADLPAVCRDADLLIAAAGKAGIINEDHLNENQVVIDVGIHVKEDGSLCGDVDFSKAEPIVGAITPVPGGVGTVTASMLAKHVIDAAKRQTGQGMPSQSRWTF